MKCQYCGSEVQVNSNYCPMENALLASTRNIIFRTSFAFRMEGFYQSTVEAILGVSIYATYGGHLIIHRENNRHGISVEKWENR